MNAPEAESPGPKPLPDLSFIEQMATAAVVAETAQLAFRELLATQLNRGLPKK
jgi:hypothetical protein